MLASENRAWPIIGHHQAAELLQRSILSGHPSHAYLFTGPPHVGKTTLARLFAQALNCETLGQPCGQCRACRLTANDRYHDVQVIQTGRDAAEGASESKSSKKSARSIGIEQIRAMQREAALAPYDARHKVCLILDAENMTTEAANCLLKTLEEPPSKVIVVLTATDASMLLPTVVSRCQQIALRPLPRETIARALATDYDVAEDQAKLLAGLSRGCVGWAINAATNRSVLEGRMALLDRMIGVLNGSRVQRFKLAEKLASEYAGNPLGLQNALGLWLEWWRDAILIKTGCPELVANADQLDTLRRVAERTPLSAIYAFARELEATMAYVEANVNVRLALEALLLRVPLGDAAWTGGRR